MNRRSANCSSVGYSSPPWFCQARKGSKEAHPSQAGPEPEATSRANVPGFASQECCWNTTRDAAYTQEIAHATFQTLQEANPGHQGRGPANPVSAECRAQHGRLQSRKANQTRVREEHPNSHGQRDREEHPDSNGHRGKPRMCAGSRPVLRKLTFSVENCGSRISAQRTVKSSGFQAPRNALTTSSLTDGSSEDQGTQAPTMTTKGSSPSLWQSSPDSFATPDW